MVKRICRVYCHPLEHSTDLWPFATHIIQYSVGVAQVVPKILSDLFPLSLFLPLPMAMCFNVHIETLGEYHTVRPPPS